VTSLLISLHTYTYYVTIWCLVSSPQSGKEDTHYYSSTPAKWETQARQT
jgi:hypothetical protein